MPHCDCGDETTCAAKCDGGSASDCFALGGCYFGPGGFASNPAKFVTYSARGCKLGSASACTNLAKAYATGFGVAPDPSRAERLFASAAEGHRTGCQEGLADDCYMLGYAYEHGEGVKADQAMSAALRQRACVLGHSVSCLLLATDARSSGSPDEAARWFGMSCEATCTVGCKEVREAVRQRVPTALRSLQRWKNGCDGGQEAACRAKRAVESGAPSEPERH
jgi:TPR repeat protein